ncbi:MAG TPA: aminotransferase class I/II-fold pyridoxal phosphate-dependent enzyme, partial [Pyrinomonadaceae bacterium]|nr:aminotransferase class I/II-fold pyridoxal phosphate-dependent enzyme [Pyrinomonadaceae bacterium]
CAMPEGAFYAYVDVREMLGDRFKTSADVADELLQKANVVVTDGTGFGGEGFLRFSYATSMENLQNAVENIAGIFSRQSPVTAP